jgi:hypothetical protein
LEGLPSGLKAIGFPSEVVEDAKGQESRFLVVISSWSALRFAGDADAL